MIRIHLIRRSSIHNFHRESPNLSLCFVPQIAVWNQTDYVTEHEITLPMYAALTLEQVDFICDTVDKVVNV